MCYSPQQIYNEAAYGGEDSPPPWIAEDAESCGCRGSGWYLSQVDTYHKCPVHYHGQLDPETAASLYDCKDEQAKVGFKSCPKCPSHDHCHKPTPVVVKEDKHKVLVSRARGRDGWLLKCSCGRVFTGWRWLCEERYNEHKC